MNHKPMITQGKQLARGADASGVFIEPKIAHHSQADPGHGAKLIPTHITAQAGNQEAIDPVNMLPGYTYLLGSNITPNGSPGALYTFRIHHS